MKTLYCWSVFLGVFIRYLFWRAGLLRRRPEFTDHPKEIPTAVTQMFRWKRRVHVVNGDLSPRRGPALFVANHHKLDDPIDLWPGIHWGSQEGIIPSFVMRDDYFNGFPWNWSPFNVNHLCEMTGAVLISRDELKMAQLRQLLGKMGRADSLVLFPGRTRSRTGAWFEYRDDVTEPGSAAFLVGQAQRRNRGLQIPMVPLARTWHPVRNSSAVVYGEPLWLAPDAGREAQRALDCELLTRIGRLVEVHAVHLTSLLLYLHALHCGGVPLPATFFVSAAEQWRAAAPHSHTDPQLLADPTGEMATALRHLAEKGAVNVLNGTVTSNAEGILSTPDWQNDYRDRNPVKYWTNQLIHLPTVNQWAEDAVRGVNHRQR